MKRSIFVLLLLLAGGSHDELKAPCTHPSTALFGGGCGPLTPVQ